MAIHIVLAARIPEMKIEPAEAHMMAEALARVSRHYPTVAAVMSGKIADHIALFSVATAVYGTRLAAISIRLKAENATPVNQTVVTFPGR